MEELRKTAEKQQKVKKARDENQKKLAKKYTKDDVRKGKNRLAADLKMEENKARLKSPGENPKVKKRIAGEQARLKKDVETKTKTFGPSPKPAPKPAPKANRATDKGGREAAPGSSGYKPTKTDMGPNMNQVNKPDAKPAPKKDDRSTMQKLFGASEERRQMGRDLQKKAQKSMGFKHGGSVKSHRGDGICKKGKTKGRFV